MQLKPTLEHPIIPPCTISIFTVGAEPGQKRTDTVDLNRCGKQRYKATVSNSVSEPCGGQQHSLQE